MYGSGCARQLFPETNSSIILGIWRAAGAGKVPVYEEGRKTPIGFEELEFDVVAESADDKDTDTCR